MFKKFFFMLVAAILVIGTMNLGSFAMVQYSDLPDNWSTDALKHTIENGIMEGYNGKIYPHHTLMRAEMATMLNRIMGATDMADLSEFTDVPMNAWYYDEIAKAVQMKTLVGINKTLNPAKKVTREEVFVALANTFKFEDGDKMNLETFKDYKEIGNWAIDATAALVSQGYIKGSDGYLNPKQPITRAEFAQLISSIAKNYINETPTMAKNYTGNVVINKPNVTLKDMTIDGNLYIGDGVGDGDITLDSVIVNGTIVVRGGGANSLNLNGSTTALNMILARVSNTLRILSQTTTPLPQLQILGQSNVILEGNYDNIFVLTPLPTLTLQNTTITNFNLNVSVPQLNINPTATINTLVVNVPNITLSGSGVIKNALVNANNVVVNTTGTIVKASQGITGTIAGGIPVSGGASSTVGTTTPSTDSGTTTPPTTNAVSIVKSTAVDARPTVEITVKLNGATQNSFELHFDNTLLASTTNGKMNVATGVLSSVSRLKVVINGTTYSGSSLTIQ